MKLSKIFVISILLISLCISFYLHKNVQTKIIVIEADLVKPKKKPEEPGGIIVPNSDSLIYEQSNFEKRKIVMLPSPEDPLFLDRKNYIDTETIYTDSIDDILNNIEYYEKLYNNQNLNLAENESNLLPNDLSILTSSANDSQSSINISLNDLKITKILDKRFTTSYNKNSYFNNDEYKIQLAISYTELDAKTKWDRIKEKFGKILINSKLVLKKIEGPNGKIFYLVMAGYYPTFNSAKHICQKLNSRQQNCTVTK